MSTLTAVLRPVPIPRRETLTRDHSAQAFMLLRIAFTVAPFLFGLDKFAGVLTATATSLRDFGLLLGAVALSLLASAHAPRDKFAQSP